MNRANLHATVILGIILFILVLSTSLLMKEFFVCVRRPVGVQPSPIHPPVLSVVSDGGTLSTRAYTSPLEYSRDTNYIYFRPIILQALYDRVVGKCRFIDHKMLDYITYSWTQIQDENHEVLTNRYQGDATHVPNYPPDYQPQVPSSYTPFIMMNIPLNTAIDNFRDTSDQAVLKRQKLLDTDGHRYQDTKAPLLSGLPVYIAANCGNAKQFLIRIVDLDTGKVSLTDEYRLATKFKVNRIISFNDRIMSRRRSYFPDCIVYEDLTFFEISLFDDPSKKMTVLSDSTVAFKDVTSGTPVRCFWGSGYGGKYHDVVPAYHHFTAKYVMKMPGLFVPPNYRFLTEKGEMISLNQDGAKANSEFTTLKEYKGCPNGFDTSLSSPIYMQSKGSHTEYTFIYASSDVF